ncbi:hypothetical protein PG995_007424 [Apiospora arundinis]
MRLEVDVGRWQENKASPGPVLGQSAGPVVEDPTGKPPSDSPLLSPQRRQLPARALPAIRCLVCLQRPVRLHWLRHRHSGRPHPVIDRRLSFVPEDEYSTDGDDHEQQRSRNHLTSGNTRANSRYQHNRNKSSDSDIISNSDDDGGSDDDDMDRPSYLRQDNGRSADPLLFKADDDDDHERGRTPTTV